jgi:S1-C subfamily serine protease
MARIIRSLDEDFDDERSPHPRRTDGDHHSRSLVIVLLIVIGIAIGALSLWVGSEIVTALKPAPEAVNPNAAPKETVANGPLDVEETEANQVFESLKDSVVNVDTVLLQRGRFEDSETPTGTGSGFIWDADGRVVTNYHVIAETYKRSNMAIRIVMSDRKVYDARVVGTAADFDLAVVQMLGVPKEKLKPIQVATSSDLKVGQKVYAIGNPFGLSLTLTSGIISNLDRSIESPTGVPIPDAIQHTAQINPGNSGGPLLNRHGKLVGVNTSIATPRSGGGNVGIGFSIPSDTVNSVVTAIIRQERPKNPDLGVRLYDEKKLRSAGYDKGVMVAEVIPGGPAALAKLHGIRRDANGLAQPGDVLLAINGEAIGGVQDFQRIVSKLKIDQKITVRYLRDEVEYETTLTVRGV